MLALLLMSLMFWPFLCNELDETVLEMDAAIVKDITTTEVDKENSIRKNVLRLELAFDEIAGRLKDGDEEGRNAVNNIIKNGGLTLSNLEDVNDTLIMNKFKWNEDKFEELKYNLQRIITTWDTMEKGVVSPTTMIYVRGRNRSIGLQTYMEKYLK